MKRTVFFLSDRTGITAETLGRSLLTQFEDVPLRYSNWPFLDSLDKAREAVSRINDRAREDGQRPLLFSTLVDPEIRQVLRESDGVLFDFFDTFTPLLEGELGRSSARVMGKSHGMGDYSRYTSRIDALNFALANDDGVSTRNYPAADIILLGVSRSGKTPTCLYLALQYGVLAANYPLTDDDLQSARLPQSLHPYRDKLFGLTIEPQRLQQIRSERRPNSRYATTEQCYQETGMSERLFKREGIRFLDTTNMSIEELAATLLQGAGLKRRLLG